MFGSYVNGNFEVAIFWWIGVIVVVGWILHVSRYGNWIFAVGGDLHSARATGIPTDRVKIGLFMGARSGPPSSGHPDDPLQQRAGRQRPGIRLQLDHRRRHRRRAADRWLRLCRRRRARHPDVRDRPARASTTRAGTPDLASLILGVLLLLAVLMNNTFRRMALSYGPRKKKASTS